MELSSYLQNGTSNFSNLLFKYYRKIDLTEQEMMMYMQIWMFQEQNNQFPDMNEIASYMTINVQEAYGLIQSLMTKKAIKLESNVDKNGRQADSYNLSLIFSLIDQAIAIESQKNKQNQSEQEISQLMQTFEQEFGRMLTPIERETVNYWLYDDKYPVELIMLALKEAVLNQAYSLKYMDRVLLSWERKNLRSKQQVLEELNRRKKSISEHDKTHMQQSQVQKPRVPLYNWLDPNNQ